MNETYRITVKLYESLVPYKEYFPNAIKMYFDHAVGKYACDYKPEEKKVSVRLKIEYQPEYYKKLLNLIEEQENIEILNKGGNQKISKTTLLNNVMSSLLNVKQYNY